MKKIILFCLLVTSTFLLHAKAYTIKCPYDSVNNVAKGIYNIETNLSLINYEVGQKKVHLSSMIMDSLEKNENLFFPFNDYNNIPGFLETDFIKFDKNGNFYIYLGCSSNFHAENLIIKYNPVKNEIETFKSGKNVACHSFDVSDDGSMLFVCYSDIQEEKGIGFPLIRAIPTDKPENSNVIFINSYETYNVIKNVCFDPNTKRLYFTVDNYQNIYGANNENGLFFVEPVNGEYLSKNIVKYTTYDNYVNVERYLNNRTDEDYKLVLDTLKEACSYNAKRDNIEISLKNFKDLEFDNYRYKKLYKEDENGNPLTEIAALKYLYEESGEEFNNFCYDYIRNTGMAFGSFKSYFPLNFLCIDKNTGESAYKIDENYFYSLSSNDYGYIFANDDGVWILEHWNYNHTSKLFQLTDKNGNFIRNQDFNLATIRLDTYHKDIKIVYGNDYIAFIPEDNSTIYYYKNNKLTDVSYLFPDVKEFSKKNLYELQNMTITESNNLNTETPKYLKIILILSISLGSAIILLLATFITLMIKEKRIRKNNPSIQSLKKNKKFIYQIQESERGKISRDIHDSIIQDIRSIRINSEMLKVTEDSQERKQTVIRLATDCVVKLRNICYNLTPAELATHVDGDDTKIELLSIIQTLVTQFIERTHVPCSIQVDENFSFPIFEKEISQNLFRIVQEALTNIEKHSYATQCSIYIKNKTENKKDYMVIYISDDGIGCDINNLLKRKKRNHFGLQNIVDRALLIGADIDFRSEIGDGLEIVISVPC